MNDYILEQLQQDLHGALRSFPNLSTVPILIDDQGDIAYRTETELETTEEGSKRGLVIIVMQPKVRKAERSQPGTFNIIAKLKVVEKVATNNDPTNGSGIRSSVAAVRVFDCLHQRQLGYCMIYGGRKVIRQSSVEVGYVSHLITLKVHAAEIQRTARVAGIDAAYDDTTDSLLLSTPTVDSTIYWTSDGSFPASWNEVASVYTAPISGLAIGTQVRAVAHKADMAPSDLLELTITED